MAVVEDTNYLWVCLDSSLTERVNALVRDQVKFS